MKKSTEKMRRRTKSTGQSPVIAARVSEPLHRQIKEAAKKSGRSMSEELAWRIAMSFAQDLGAQLRQAGYTPIGMVQGIVWAEPGVNVSRLSISIDADAVVREMQPELVQTLARALGKFAKTNTAGGDQ